MKYLKLWILAPCTALAVVLVACNGPSLIGLASDTTSSGRAGPRQTFLRWPASQGQGPAGRRSAAPDPAAFGVGGRRGAAPALSDAVTCTGPIHFLGGSAARPVYLVPSLLTTQSSCSIDVRSPQHHDSEKFTGVLRLANGVQAVAAAQQPATEPAVTSEHLAAYQRMNVRNVLMILKSAHEKDWPWANICPVFSSGVDCMIDQAGIVDQILLKPIDLGNVLDYGADPTGAQLLQLQRYARGFKVGFNVVGSPEGFLAAGSSNSTAFVFGHPHDRLPFADETFDTVLSMNILEHVQDIQLYLSEAARVLRPGGHLYISWYPSWQSARGHHIHPDMVDSMAEKLNCSHVAYNNDGSTIPDWGHLLMSKERFIGHLRSTAFRTCSSLSEEVADYVYRNPDLNRKTYEEAAGILKSIESLQFLRVDVTPEDGLPELTQEVWRQLRTALPNSTHFKIAEARLTLQKRL